MSHDSFETRDTLNVGGKTVEYRSLPRLAARGHRVERLPWSLPESA